MRRRRFLCPGPALVQVPELPRLDAAHGILARPPLESPAATLAAEDLEDGHAERRDAHGGNRLVDEPREVAREVAVCERRHCVWRRAEALVPNVSSGLKGASDASAEFASDSESCSNLALPPRGFSEPQTHTGHQSCLEKTSRRRRVLIRLITCYSAFRNHSCLVHLDDDCSGYSQSHYETLRQVCRSISFSGSPPTLLGQ